MAFRYVSYVYTYFRLELLHSHVLHGVPCSERRELVGKTPVIRRQLKNVQGTEFRRNFLFFNGKDRKIKNQF